MLQKNQVIYTVLTFTFLLFSVSPIKGEEATITLFDELSKLNKQEELATKFDQLPNNKKEAVLNEAISHIMGSLLFRSEKANQSQDLFAALEENAAIIAPKLRNILKNDPDIEKRAEAASLLGIVRDKDSAPLLLNYFNDSNEQLAVRAKSAIALGKLNHAVLPILDELLKTYNPLLPRKASDAFFHFESFPEEGIKKLRKAVQTSSKSKKQQRQKNNALYLLGKIQHESAAPMLVDELKKKSQDPLIVSSLAQALYYSGSKAKEAAPLLQELYKQNTFIPPIQDQLLKAFASTAGKDAFPFLANIIESKNADSSLLKTAVDSLLFIEENEPGAISKEHGVWLGSLFSPFSKDNEKLPADQFTERSRLLETLYTKTAPENQKELENLINQGIGIPETVENKDVCESLCKMAAQSGAWISKDYLSYSPSYFRKNEPHKTWGFAIAALNAIFHVETAQYCSKESQPYREDLIKAWRNRKAPSSPFYVNGPIFKKHQPESAKDYEEFRNNLKKANDNYIPPQLEEFLKKASQTCRIPPTQPSDIYGKQFYLLFLRKMVQHDLLQPSEKVEANNEIKKISDELVKDYGCREIETGSFTNGSSLTHLHSYSTSLLSLPEVPEDEISRMTKILKAFGPENIPYGLYEFSPGRDSGPVDKLLRTRRGSAARRPPFHLFMYLNADNNNKEVDRNNLIDAIDNFSHFSPQLIAYMSSTSISGHSMYLNFDTGEWVGNGIAPYYYYPSVVFVTAAIRLLEKDRKLSKEQRTTIEKVKKKLRAQLLYLLEDKGTFRHPHDAGEKENAPWVNPLAGLALIPLMEECRGKKVDSLGILMTPPAPAYALVTCSYSK